MRWWTRLSRSLTHQKWVQPLRNAKNPIDVVVRIIQSTSLRGGDLERRRPSAWLPPE